DDLLGRRPAVARRRRHAGGLETSLGPGSRVLPGARTPGKRVRDPRGAGAGHAGAGLGEQITGSVGRPMTGVPASPLCEDSSMRLLVIGGTRFVGKHIVEEAVRRGHELTLFNRGSMPAPTGVSRVITGDRNTDLARLSDGHWDAVVDTSAYLPRQVRSAAALLEPRVEHYLFISTVSVYADPTVADQDESGTLGRLEDEAVEEITEEAYGPLKV